MPKTDFDGDGLDDVLWRERDFDLVGTWLATDTGGFTNNSANSLIGVPEEWLIVATGDFDGDGNDDIAWHNLNNGLLGYWEGQDDGGFVVHNGLLPLSDFAVLSAGDFDGNGRDELLITSRTTPVFAVDIVFAYNGELSYSDGPYADVSINWNVAGVGDFNGDGRDDILWRNVDGRLGNWLSSEAFNSFGQGFIVNDASIVQVSNDWQVAGIGDFNGDTYSDILWRHANGLLGTWSGTETGVFAVDYDSEIPVPIEWQVVQTGDFDGDGNDDLLWRNSNNGAFGTWLGDESGAFTINPGPLVIVPNNWIIQPNTAGAGLWDYY